MKTGEDGTVDVVCAEGIMSFDVKARGFDPLHAYIKPSTQSPLVVGLTRGQWLDITAAGDGGGALTGCFVVVAFETPQPRSGGSKIYMMGMTGFEQHVAVSEQADIYEGSGGHLLIGELPVSEPVTVSLIDAAACTLMSESLSLARGETRDVKLHTGRRGRTLSIAVRDGNGRAVSHAQVSFGPHVTAAHGGRHGELFRTRGTGVVRPVYGDARAAGVRRARRQLDRRPHRQARHDRAAGGHRTGGGRSTRGSGREAGPRHPLLAGDVGEPPPGAHFNVPLLPVGDYRVTLVPRSAPQNESGLARPATVTIVAHQTASVTLTP